MPMHMGASLILMNEAKEAECRRELVERIVSDLQGLGEKVSENASSVNSDQLNDIISSHMVTQILISSFSAHVFQQVLYRSHYT